MSDKNTPAAELAKVIAKLRGSGPDHDVAISPGELTMLLSAAELSDDVDLQATGIAYEALRHSSTMEMALANVDYIRSRLIEEFRKKRAAVKLTEDKP